MGLEQSMSERGILFLHGLAGDPEDWDGVAARLDGVETLAPRVEYLAEGVGSLPELADRVRAGLPAGWRGRTVVGNSLGGMLALAMAGEGVDLRRLVLVGSHLSTGFGFLRRDRRAVRDEIARIFHEPHRLSEERVRHYEAKWAELVGSRRAFGRLRGLKRAVQGFDAAPLYERLQERIVLVCGLHDRLSPLAEFRSLQARYPGMRLEVVDRCGHAVPLERPGRLASILQGELGLGG
jgi:pimeloyl-ACP methyl ester carboxylesterase